MLLQGEALHVGRGGKRGEVDLGLDPQQELLQPGYDRRHQRPLQQLAQAGSVPEEALRLEPAIAVGHGDEEPPPRLEPAVHLVEHFPQRGPRDVLQDLGGDDDIGLGRQVTEPAAQDAAVEALRLQEAPPVADARFVAIEPDHAETEPGQRKRDHDTGAAAKVHDPVPWAQVGCDPEQPLLRAVDVFGYHPREPHPEGLGGVASAQRPSPWEPTALSAHQVARNPSSAVTPRSSSPLSAR